MTQAEKFCEEQKRARVMGHDVWTNIISMIQFAEAQLPPEARRNRPRQPHPMQYPRNTTKSI